MSQRVLNKQLLKDCLLKVAKDYDRFAPVESFSSFDEGWSNVDKLHRMLTINNTLLCQIAAIEMALARYLVAHNLPTAWIYAKTTIEQNLGNYMELGWLLMVLIDYHTKHELVSPKIWKMTKYQLMRVNRILSDALAANNQHCAATIKKTCLDLANKLEEIVLVQKD